VPLATPLPCHNLNLSGREDFDLIPDPSGSAMPPVFDKLKTALAYRYAIERELGEGGIGRRLPGA
jgi:hypothetical protein